MPNTRTQLAVSLLCRIQEGAPYWYDTLDYPSVRADSTGFWILTDWGNPGRSAQIKQTFCENRLRCMKPAALCGCISDRGVEQPGSSSGS